MAIDDDLVVVSSNFDQRYNAGRVHLYDLPTLVQKVPPAGLPVFFDEDLESASKASLRIDQFGSDVVRVRNASGQDWLLIPSRGRNQVTIIDYLGGSLSCGGLNTETTRFDCGDDRSFSTGGQDPFSVVVTGDQTADPVAYVGHVRADFNDNDNIFRQSLTRIGLSDFPSAPPTVVASTFADFGGVTGIAFIPPGNMGVPANHPELKGTLVVVERNRAPRLRLRAFRVVDDGTSVTLEPSDFINFGDTLQAVASRGLIYDVARGQLHVALHLQESGDSSNGAIVTVDVSGDTFRPGRVTRVGEELGRPVMHPDATRALLYVPDLRNNVLWAMDVSSPVPQVRHRIEGRGSRTFSNGVTKQVALLATPIAMTFYEAGGRTFGFIANFANSTLAVMDVTAAEPREHRVVARLGRDIDPEGLAEIDKEDK